MFEFTIYSFGRAGSAPRPASLPNDPPSPCLTRDSESPRPESPPPQTPKPPEPPE